MRTFIFHSLPASIAALLYTAGAVFVVFQERYHPSGGGWISLTGMASWLVTAPVSLPCELLGAKLDYRSNLHMAFAILICAGLAYGVGLGAEKLFRLLFSSGA